MGQEAWYKKQLLYHKKGGSSKWCCQNIEKHLLCRKTDAYEIIVTPNDRYIQVVVATKQNQEIFLPLLFLKSK